MGNGEPRYTFDRVVRLGLSAAVGVALFALLRYLSDVLLPFVAAVVLAYLLNPFVTLLEKKTKRRGLAVACVVVGLGVVGMVLVVVLVPLVIGQVHDFAGAVEKLRADVVASVESPGAQPDAAARPQTETPPELAPLADSAPSGKTTVGWRELKEAWGEYRRDGDSRSRSERFARLREHVRGTYAGYLLERIVAYTGTEEFSRLAADTVRRVIASGWTAASFLVNLILGLTGLIVVFLYLVFLLLDYPEYARTWKTFLPPSYRDGIVDFLDQFTTAMQRYFRGQAFVALWAGALLAIGFSIIGLPMAIPFGLFVGLLNMVPYLQAVGLVPAMLLAALRAVEGDSSLLASVLLTLLVFAVVQVIQDGVIAPRVMGKATGLRPVAMLLGVFVWGKLLGFMGLLLAIPLTCLGIAYYRRYVLRYTADTKTRKS